MVNTFGLENSNFQVGDTDIWAQNSSSTGAALPSCMELDIIGSTIDLSNNQSDRPNSLETELPMKHILSNCSDTSLVAPAFRIMVLCASGTRVTLDIDKQFTESHSIRIKEGESIKVSQLKKIIYKTWKKCRKDQLEGQLLESTSSINDIQCTHTSKPSDTSDPSNAKVEQYWGTALAGSTMPTPISPDHIRLIHFGKILVDSCTLENYNISPSNLFNVLHLSVRPDSINARADQAKRKFKLVAERSGLSSSPFSGRGSTAEIQNLPRDTGDARAGCCTIC